MSRPNEVSKSPLLLSLLLAQQSLLLSWSERIRILISLQRILTPLKRARHLLLVRVPAHHRLLPKLSQSYSLFRGQNLEDPGFGQ